MSIEGVANTEYASLSGKIHTIVVDKTLSISGACADAKATGDAIEKVESGIDAANEALEEAKAAYDKAVEDMAETAEDVAKEAVNEVATKALPKVSMNAPTDANNVAAGHAIGQTWLRPNYTLTNIAYNKAAEDFVATACAVTKEGQTFTIAGNGDDKVISAELNHGSANGWLYCVVTPDATAASANLVIGGETVALTVGEANTIQRRYTGESIKFEATYETANIASTGTITVENLTIIDEAATLAQVDESCRDVSDDTVFGFVLGNLPLSTYKVLADSWQHLSDGVWRGGLSAFTNADLLSDATREIYGLDYLGTPDDVLSILALTQGVYAFRITVTLPDGTPVPGALLNGILATDRESTAVTDENGVCALAVSFSDTLTVSISNYIGIGDKTVALAAVPGLLVTPVKITVEDKRSELLLIQTSGEYKIFPGTVDMCAVGGGSNGSAYYDGAGGNYYGNGGGGGYVENMLDETFVYENHAMSIQIGVGGSASPYNKENRPGGNTVVAYKGLTITANGAAGKTGNGNGGTGDSSGGAAGSDGQVHIFNDTSLPRPGGGGGGAGGYNKPVARGGADYGGRGANYYGSSGSSSQSGLGPGGGGGGGSGYTNGPTSNINSPGAGANGGLYVRYKEGIA